MSHLGRASIPNDSNAGVRNVFDDGLLDSHTFDEHIQKRADLADIHQATALSISDGR